MSETQTQARPAHNKALIAVAAAAGVLLIGVIVLLVILLLKKEAPAALPVAEPGTGNAVMDDGFDPAAFQKAAAENMFEVKMSNLWEFPDGASAASDAYVANSTANSLPFYFQLVLPDSENPEEQEVLFTSPVVPVGGAVRDITLNRDLEPGLYECVCLYHNLNPDNTIESTLSVVVRINVLG